MLTARVIDGIVDATGIAIETYQLGGIDPNPKREDALVAAENWAKSMRDYRAAKKAQS